MVRDAHGLISAEMVISAESHASFGAVFWVFVISVQQESLTS